MMATQEVGLQINTEETKFLSLNRRRVEMTT